MAPDNTDWQLEHEYYTIADPHDLVIRVVEHEDITRTEGNGTITESKACKLHIFKVKRDTLSNSGPYFRKLLTNGNFKEASQDTIDMHEDSVKGLALWFKLLHDKADESTYKAGIDDVWFMLATANKYGFDPGAEVATKWFGKWYEFQTRRQDHSFDYMEHQQLLFPCFTFDHIQGFRAATKYLVYRASGHITEKRPDGFSHDHLHMDPIVLQQLNAAKGRLKTILHRSLYAPINGLLKEARCRCRADVLYAYEQALANTGAWPLEAAFLGHSVDRVLKMLDGFPGPRALTSQTCGASACSFNFAPVVGKAREECRQYFDGLCLDCMNTSKPKFGDANEDYWQHSKQGVPWDAGCRIRHQQPSWYFSFMGRRYKMVEWVDRSHSYSNRGYGQRGAGGGGGGAGQAAAPRSVASGEEEVHGLQELNLQ
ncbi:hypothetical protein LTR08_007916 [Meristemomyces frigidus]|nr:hypothetical protein LTR08_007916 [Meristemomyces frigidus]